MDELDLYAIGGSSPRMRGTEFGVGIAHAGNINHVIVLGSSPRMRGTASVIQFLAQCSVHPRACGEQSFARHRRFYPPRFIPAHAGNSHGCHPRFTGSGSRWPTRRFIPAHAGNRSTRLWPVPSTGIPAHRGTAGQASAITGSSPRMRGTAVSDSEKPLACPVHPRACGEQSFAAEKVYPSGSSPRMRGTGRSFLGEDGVGRFIPAHAGNSMFHSLAWTDSWTVHPRACGEQSEALLGSVDSPVHPRACGEQPFQAGSFFL